VQRPSESRAAPSFPEASNDGAARTSRAPSPSSSEQSARAVPLRRRFPSSTAANGPARARIADATLAAACLGGIAFLLLQILTFGYGRDQGIYAMVGRAILAGQMPYRDAWDFKPPGIFLIYAAARAVFRSGQAGIRIVECLGLVGMVVGMVKLTERWWGARLIGLLAGLMAVLIHAQLDFWHTAQPESFGGMVTIAALLVLGPGPWSEQLPTPGRRSFCRFAASGMLFGIAGLLKPPLAGGGAVVAIALAIQAFTRYRSVAAVVRPIAVVALGGALPIVFCLAWFAARGALHDLWDVLFVFTPHYTLLGWEGETVPGMLYCSFTEWLVTYSSVPTVGLLLLLGFCPTLRREKGGVLLLAGLIAVHLVGVAMQGKFFPYHYGATWPLTALLAALGFFRVWERLVGVGFARVPLFFAGCSLIALGRTATKDVPQSFGERAGLRLKLFTDEKRDQRAIDRLASVADVNAIANRAVAEELRAHVPEGRTTFIWGFEPVIYDIADRLPATRYLYDVPQRVAWAKAKERAVLMRDLAVSHPAAIVVEHRDVFPMVTGDMLDSADTLATFPELVDLLATRYRLADTIEDFDIYLER
jgi:hypothetical protein